MEMPMTNEEILSGLHSNSDISFKNGSGYIQHNRHDVISARRKLMKAIYEGVDPFDQRINDYAFGRMLDDTNNPHYGTYVRLFLCIDNKTWREYGQPYFAINPGEAEDVCLNKVSGAKRAVSKKKRGRILQL
jgi:hypothetical protein